MPSVKDGHTTAAVTLIKGADSKTENEKLDRPSLPTRLDPALAPVVKFRARW